ncbi:sialate O-acetylesterase [Puniceicoccales bacterium CK1056]|uniref:Sialate O-acetylesterase n=1 Tax=Oceanipulchritudo coccoides TaxID=2706888 RepID=A0A6B2M471_9BACT|nr:sialate O-acetylesterase [Oceanipulchritudo coccoides]NDV62904.1 sialate O-acetylesterase [Oceanipulchritudo coccoides]
MIKHQRLRLQLFPCCLLILGLLQAEISAFGQGLPERFIYADSVSTTGGQFNVNYPPENLINNGFTTAADIIDTSVSYISSGQNYATASGTLSGFNLVFDFASEAEIDGMHVWNYQFRNGDNGSTSPNAGLKDCTLSFFSGTGGSGTQIGEPIDLSLAAAIWGTENPAQTIAFPTTVTGVRSVVMRVNSNHGSGSFSGLNELAFNGSVDRPGIDTFMADVPFAQMPETPTLSWSVSGNVTSLEISPDIGNVLYLTEGGSGSIAVAPIGEQTYTLTLNDTITSSVSVIGLPPREKLHIYLLIGQSNMQGAGAPYDPSLDAPDPRVLKFGSRNGLESVWVKGGHPLTALTTSSSGAIGMGVEFGKTLLAAQSDPEIVIGLINHAIGSSAIQWWAPGVIDNKQVNPLTGLNYYLYDEAVQRVTAATQYGILKGVLWHQGEYNSNNNTNPDPDPEGYAARLQTLVTNLRESFSNPSLPFICGKFVPASWVDEGGTTVFFTGLPNRAIVEAALEDLPNQLSNTFCVDNVGLRGRPDQKIHFDAHSQRLLGQRYAAAILDLQSDPYRLWLGGFLSPAELANPQLASAEADLDRDGLLNYLEFAFLTDPTRSEEINPLSFQLADIPDEGLFPTLVYRQRFDKDAPNYQVNVSNDLLNWRSNLDEPVTVEFAPSVDNQDGTFRVSVRSLAPVDQSAPGLFLQLRIEPR